MSLKRDLRYGHRAVPDPSETYCLECQRRVTWVRGMWRHEAPSRAAYSPTLPATSSGTSGRLDKVLAHATIAGRPSGSVLRLERLALRIDQTAFARAMGVSRQRLDILERREWLSPEMVERYRGALRMIVTIVPDADLGVDR